MRRPRAQALLTALLLPAAAGLAGCAGHPADGFLVPPGPVDRPPAELAATLAAAGVEPEPRDPDGPPPEWAEVEIDGERRPAMLTPTAGWRWHGRVPADAELLVGVQAVPAAWRRIDDFAAAVAVVSGGEREVLEAVRAEGGREAPADANGGPGPNGANGAGQRWLDLAVDLGRFAGREVTLEFTAAAHGVPDGHRADPFVAWAPAALTRRRGPARRSPAATAAELAARPNILFVVIDTLRADHLTPYGYARDTSPTIARLAAEGTVVTEAYSQAPWTLPSAVSFMTGRYPGEMLAGAGASFAIPEGVPSLAERLRALGYRTAGFFANPTLHAGNGFARGFESFYTPPPVVDSLKLHAESLNARALPWIAAYQREPFFLYLHYLDPHDPYVNADQVDGRSRFFPDYRGELTGEVVHGVYLGKVPLADPVQDVAQLTALYDSEIAYVDRHLGELLASFDPAVLARTLIVLTADHGEELHDHGGWKHGETLYQELIRVPLVWRWDARILAGGRLAGTVRLLDLVPTILSAAGGTGQGLDGVDLLPALTGTGPLPRRPAFAEGLSAGPLRAAAVLDGWKLVLFDRAAPFTPADPIQEFIWRRDLGRLRREELYHLAVDPAERRDLLTEGGAGAGAGSGAGEPAARLATVVLRRLERELPGLRVMAGELPAGSVLTATIDLAATPEGWSSYFLGDGDRATLSGRRLELRLTGERADGVAQVKGVRVTGEAVGIDSMSLTLDGRLLAPERVTVGAGRRWSGGPLAAADLVAAEPPAAAVGAADDIAADPAPDRPLLVIWRPVATGTGPAPAPESEETRRRLRSLGYVQ